MFEISCEYLGVTSSRYVKTEDEIGEAFTDIDQNFDGDVFKCSGTDLRDGFASEVSPNEYGTWKTSWVKETGILAGIATAYNHEYGEALLACCNQLLANSYSSDKIALVTDMEGDPEWEQTFNLGNYGGDCPNQEVLNELDTATWKVEILDYDGFDVDGEAADKIHNRQTDRANLDIYDREAEVVYWFYHAGYDPDQVRKTLQSGEQEMAAVYGS